MNSEFIDNRNLQKNLDDSVLHDIHADAGAGSVIGVPGLNDSGKSTPLK